MDLSDFLGDVSFSFVKLKDEIHQVMDELDLDVVFESLLDVIMSSSFSGMLAMIGGREALSSLKEPFIEKMVMQGTSVLYFTRREDIKGFTHTMTLSAEGQSLVDTDEVTT